MHIQLDRQDSAHWPAQNEHTRVLSVSGPSIARHLLSKACTRDLKRLVHGNRYRAHMAPTSSRHWQVRKHMSNYIFVHM